VKTATNKRLLISESHGDSNRCTPCRGNLINMSHTFHARSAYSPRPYVSHVVRIEQYFVKSSTESDRYTALKKKCSRLHLSARLSDPQDPPQFLSQHSHWSSALKPSICWRQATRITGLISSACNQYIQYLLAGANPSVLNWHRQRLQPWRCQLTTSHSPTFPINDPPLFT
jgi:hypothetical protein